MLCKRRRFFFSLVALFVAGSFSFSSSVWAERKMIFTTGVDTSFLQVPIAKERGIFKKHGLDVTVRKFTAGLEGFKALLAGESDASVSATPAVIAGLAQGANVRVIGTSRAGTGPYSAIVAVSDIKKPQDLLGRNVGVTWGSSGSHMFFLLYTKYHNLDRDKIQTKQLQGQEMLIAFSRGDIDAYFAWPPWWSRGLPLRKGAHVLAYSNDNSVQVGTQSLVVSKKVSEEKEVIKSIVRSFIEAEQFKETHPVEAIKLLAKEYNMTEKEVENELKAQTHHLELSGISFTDFCNSARFMIELKRVDKAPDWETAILPEFLKEIDPSRISYGKFIDCR